MVQDSPKSLARAFGETDHIQTRGLVDLFWRSCWHDFVSTLYEREADVKIMRSRCQGKCEADVKANAKPMSRGHPYAHTPNGSTHSHKQIDAKWKYAVRCFLSVCNDY